MFGTAVARVLLAELPFESPLQATKDRRPIKDIKYRMFFLQPCRWQPGGLGVLREVFHGFSEEARTRGFPSPPFGGFGFIGICCASFIRLYGNKVLTYNLIRRHLYRQLQFPMMALAASLAFPQSPHNPGTIDGQDQIVLSPTDCRTGLQIQPRCHRLLS